jgi:hypothetical protein
MKVLVPILVSILFSQPLLGQQLPTEQLFMSDTTNQKWLTELKAQQIPLQWKMVSDRYFANVDLLSNKGDNSKLTAPVLIIDGIAINITDKTNAETKTKLRSLLAEEKIASVQVIDKELDGLYINKAFTGIILVRTNDKKNSKTLLKIKFNLTDNAQHQLQK